MLQYFTEGSFEHDGHAHSVLATTALFSTITLAKHFILL